MVLSVGTRLTKKSYLVLFQELLTISDVKFPDGRMMSFTEAVQKRVQEVHRIMHSIGVYWRPSDSFLQVVSMESGVGLGNGVFTCTHMSDVFVFGGIAEKGKEPLLIKWICWLLLHTVFTPERVGNVLERLSTDVTELLRDGIAVCSAATVQALDGSQLSNDTLISILEQRAFFAELIQSVEGEAVATCPTFYRVHC